MSHVLEALAKVQAGVRCPKGRRNEFGNFSYRSLEDINAALKPLCAEQGAAYWFTDEIVEVGERHYLRTVATFAAAGFDGTVEAVGWAREPEVKKGMDPAQVTGLASSYARKYAACGLFAIDSGEDPDAMDNRPQKARQPRREQPTAAPGPDLNAPATNEQVNHVAELAAQFADMRGRSVADVMRALCSSKVLGGLPEDSAQWTYRQAGRAAQVLCDWIAKATN